MNLLEGTSSFFYFSFFLKNAAGPSILLANPHSMSKDFTSDYGAVALVVATLATTFLWSAVALAYPIAG